ncbi:MAG: tocopherol cyclase family protein [Oscillospiraceae bacterium]|nr:tocopherol cyclase family protein [Oscillospiraceae bacterium]
MSGKFSGYYFRHQKNGQTVAFIPGVSDDGAFIQMITDHRSYHFEFPSAVMSRKITIGKNRFSTEGIHIDLPGIRGNILYSDVTPLKSDIMGPFRFFPMECRHKIVSMHHRLNGSLKIGNEIYDFENGTGYIEGDSGKSFPKKYIWIQANDFANGSSVMMSVAEIPFCGFRFEGCICVVLKDGKEYRLATYLGARAESSKNSIVVYQRSLRLEADLISKGMGFPLASPRDGKLRGITKENNNATVLFRLSDQNKTICELLSANAGFECVGYPPA